MKDISSLFIKETSAGTSSRPFAKTLMSLKKKWPTSLASLRVI